MSRPVSGVFEVASRVILAEARQIKRAKIRELREVEEAVRVTVMVAKRESENDSDSDSDDESEVENFR